MDLHEYSDGGFVSLCQEEQAMFYSVLVRVLYSLISRLIKLPYQLNSLNSAKPYWLFH